MVESFLDYSWTQDFEAGHAASKYWIRQIIIAVLIYLLLI